MSIINHIFKSNCYVERSLRVHEIRINGNLFNVVEPYGTSHHMIDLWPSAVVVDYENRGDHDSIITWNPKHVPLMEIVEKRSSDVCVAIHSDGFIYTGSYPLFNIQGNEADIMISGRVEVGTILMFNYNIDTAYELGVLSLLGQFDCIIEQALSETGKI